MIASQCDIYLTFVLHVCLAFQEVVRVCLNGFVSLSLLSHPLLPLPSECHPVACVCAVSRGLLNQRNGRIGGKGK